MGVDNFLRFLSPNSTDKKTNWRNSNSVHPEQPEKTNFQKEIMTRKIGEMVKIAPGDNLINRQLAKLSEYSWIDINQQFEILDIELDLSKYPVMAYQYKVQIGSSYYWLTEENISNRR